MSTFKIGDVVQLKSGSPPMTINACYENNIFDRWTMCCTNNASARRQRNIKEGR